MYDLSLFKMASCTGEECITPKGLKELDGGPRLSLNTSSRLLQGSSGSSSGELSRRAVLGSIAMGRSQRY